MATAPSKRPFLVSMDEYSFKWWFNYFYDEIPDTQKQRFFDKLFDGDGREKKKVIERLSGHEKRSLLTEMFKLGFQEFSGTYWRDPAQLLADSKLRSSKGKSLGIAFRSDLRDAKTIKLHGGVASLSKWLPRLCQP